MNISVDYLDGIDVIYWINLDRAKDRKQHMENIFKDEIFKNKKIIRISAIDYKKKNLLKYFTTSYQRATEPEYACLISHLETIRIFSETNYKNALILEDDISIDYKKYWIKTINEIIKDSPKDWEILKLCITIEYNIKNFKDLYTNWNKTIIPLSYNHNNELRLEADWGAQSYLINNKSAKKFIKNIYHNKKFVLDDCIPHYSDFFIYKLLNTYIYKYPYFTYNEGNKTYIQNYGSKKYIKENIKKNIKAKLLIKHQFLQREKLLKNIKTKSMKTTKL